MQRVSDINLRKPIHYDADRRRLWIFGQRCHHGATGALITAAAAGLLARSGLAAPTQATLAGARAAWRGAVLASVGSMLMLHDWHDHSLWFQPGPGTQA